MTLPSDPHAGLRQVAERWGDPDGHMAEYWNAERPVIKREDVPVEIAAANMGDGFKLQKLIYTKTFMWDYDSMAPRMGTPFHSHYQDEAWQVVSGEGMFRTDHGAFRIEEGDYLFLPGGHNHQIANLSAEVPLVYQVMLVPPITKGSIIVREPFAESDFDRLEG